MLAYFLRGNNLPQAREQAAKLASATGRDWPGDRMVSACLNHAPEADVDKDARDLAAMISNMHDPEARYLNSAYLAVCGRKDAALRLIKGAIAGHYCPYNDLQTNAMLASLRNAPEFAELLSAAKQCRDSFVADRSQSAH